MNIYTIVSPHASLAQQKIAQILKQNTIATEDVTTYDMQEVALQEALFDVLSVGFLSPKKAVLIKNPYFLTGTIFKGPEHDLDKLVSYLKNPSPENILIIHGAYEKLDERKKIVKTLKKDFEYLKIESPKEYNLSTQIEQSLGQNQIQTNPKAIQELINRTKSNIDKITNELNKINAFFINRSERVLTVEIVNDLVGITLEDNVFSLTEAIANQKRDTAYQIFNDLITQKEEPIKLIVMIANQFRLFKQIQVLQQRGMYEKDIASTLGVHPYRVKIGMGNVRKFRPEYLDAIMVQLADIDIMIKTGKTDAVTALELFILGL